VVGVEPTLQRNTILSRARLPIPPHRHIMLEAPVGIEPTIEELQSSALPLGYGAKSHWSGRRDSNPRPRPWQGRILPLNYFRIMAGLEGIEPTHVGIKIRCLTTWLQPNKMGRLKGIEPSNAGITIRCVNHFATIAIMILRSRGSRNRTRADGFGDRSSTAKLCP